MTTGQAEALRGRAVPGVALPSSAGGTVSLAASAASRAVVFVYPMTARPGRELPPGWDTIPGARGCTPEACGFRDRHAALLGRGVAVYGLSSQSPEDQAEAVERLGLPYPLVSDAGFVLERELGLPTFEAGGRSFYRRLTLVVGGGLVEHAFYPVADPASHATEVVAWLATTVGSA